MIQLPADILLEIFLSLHQLDKVECMFVCHQWKRIIEDFALYHAVTLRKRSSLDKLREKIQENSEIGNKVQQLIILYDVKDKRKLDLGVLLSLLPNLRVLISFRDSTLSRNSGLTFDKKIKFPWSQSIEYVNDNNRSQPMFQHILLSRIFPNLLSLTIYIDKKKKMISLLKNAPALKYLTFMGAEFDLNDFETLHNNAPNLISLTLNQPIINNSKLPDDITPAMSTTQCTLVSIIEEDNQSITNLLVYISKKYPNLSKLNFNAELNYEETEYFTTNGWDPFFKSMGAQLRHLNITMEAGIVDLVGMLDKYNYQINHYDVVIDFSSEIAKLAQSQQIHHIQSLVLTVVVSEGTSKFEWLDKFYVLKQLKVIAYGYEQTIKIKRIIDHSPPTLRALAIKRFDLIVDPEYTGTSNIEDLSFSKVQFSEDADIFIDQHFPKVSKFKLESCDLHGKIFNLPSLNLSTFRFSDIFPTKKQNILIKTRRNNELRFYSLKYSIYLKPGPERNYFYNLPYKTYPANMTKTKPSFTLQCNSLECFSFQHAERSIDM